MSTSMVAAGVVLALVLVVVLVVVAARNATTVPNPGMPLTPDQEAQVLEVARGGNKIEAIKLHRELTGAGLEESKDAVEALLAGTPVARPAARGSMTPEQEAQVVAAARAGNKIEAIRLHR